MGYSKIDVAQVADAKKRAALEKADMYLSDVFGLLWAQRIAEWNGGRGNLIMTLALLCVVDGLAILEFPTAKRDKGQHFKRFVRERLSNFGKWSDVGNEAKVLYTEFRNSLVHEIAAKRASQKSGKLGEPKASTWDTIQTEFRDIGTIDTLAEWPDKWATIRVVTNKQGQSAYKLNIAAFYWSVKRATEQMCRENSSHA